MLTMKRDRLMRARSFVDDSGLPLVAVDGLHVLILWKTTVDFTSVNQRSTTVPSSNTTPSTTLPMPLTPLASSVHSRWNNFNSDLNGMTEAAVRLGILA